MALYRNRAHSQRGVPCVDVALQHCPVHVMLPRGAVPIVLVALFDHLLPASDACLPTLSATQRSHSVHGGDDRLHIDLRAHAVTILRVQNVRDHGTNRGESTLLRCRTCHLLLHPYSLSDKLLPTAGNCITWATENVNQYHRIVPPERHCPV